MMPYTKLTIKQERLRIKTKSHPKTLHRVLTGNYIVAPVSIIVVKSLVKMLTLKLQPLFFHIKPLLYFLISAEMPNEVCFIAKKCLFLCGKHI